MQTFLNFDDLTMTFVISGTIYYLSDGLETLRYLARDIFVIIITPGSLPGNIWLRCYYGAILLCTM